MQYAVKSSNKRYPPKIPFRPQPTLTHFWILNHDNEKINFICETFSHNEVKYKFSHSFITFYLYVCKRTKLYCILRGRTAYIHCIVFECIMVDQNLVRYCGLFGWCCWYFYCSNLFTSHSKIFLAGSYSNNTALLCENVYQQNFQIVKAKDMAEEKPFHNVELRR